MTSAESEEELKHRRLTLSFSCVCADIMLLSQDELISLDHVVQDELVRRMRDDDIWRTIP